MSHLPPQKPGRQAGRFSRAHRLRLREDFARVYQRRCRASDDLLLCYADWNAEGVTRIGLSVSRKLGGAVRRNRIKRRIREAFRHHAERLPAGVDLLVVSRTPECAAVPFDRLCRSLVSVAVRAANRLPRRPHGKSGRTQGTA